MKTKHKYISWALVLLLTVGLILPGLVGTVHAAEPDIGYEVEVPALPVAPGSEVTVTIRMTGYTEDKPGLRGFQIDIGDVDNVLPGAICTSLVTDQENVLSDTAKYQSRKDIVRHLYAKMSGTMDYSQSDLLRLTVKVPETYNKAGTLSLPLTVLYQDENNDKVTHKGRIDIRYDPNAAPVTVVSTVMDPSRDLSLGLQFFVADSRKVASVDVSYEKGTVVQKSLEELPVQDGLYTITAQDIAAKEMEDAITFTFRDEAGKAIHTETTSVRDYAMTILNGAVGKNAESTLYVDMLNYGAAAQQYFHYREDDLANAQVTSAQQTFATADIASTDIVNAQSKGTGYGGSCLELTNQIKLKIAIQKSKVKTVAYAVISYTSPYGGAYSKTIQPGEFESNGNYWVFTAPELSVADSRTVVKCVIYDSTGKAISTSTDSMESYASRMKPTGNEWDIYKTILKFSRSAIAYAGK